VARAFLPADLVLFVFVARAFLPADSRFCLCMWRGHSCPRILVLFVGGAHTIVEPVVPPLPPCILLKTSVCMNHELELKPAHSPQILQALPHARTNPSSETERRQL
jgi:hypothetical protein